MDNLKSLAPFIAIIAVLISFGLGQLDLWRRQRREARGARTLLRLEIDDNLAEVRRYRAEASDRAVEEMLPPAWQKEAWASQIGRLPAALSVPELVRVRAAYSRLDLVAEHHQRARDAAADPPVQAREVEEIDALTRTLVRDGNPLSPRHHDARHRRWLLLSRAARRRLLLVRRRRAIATALPLAPARFDAGREERRTGGRTDGPTTRAPSPTPHGGHSSAPRAVMPSGSEAHPLALR